MTCKNCERLQSLLVEAERRNEQDAALISAAATTSTERLVRAEKAEARVRELESELADLRRCEHGRADYRCCPHCLGIGSLSRVALDAAEQEEGT